MSDIIGAVYLVIGLFVAGAFIAEAEHASEKPVSTGLIGMMLLLGVLFWPAALGMRFGRKWLAWGASFPPRFASPHSSARTVIARTALHALCQGSSHTTTISPIGLAVNLSCRTAACFAMRAMGRRRLVRMSLG
ncbi:hypothetical protein Pam5_37 [Pseudanabaena phage Pam5]|nr:hypothetical protein Pam5_37 [Pseudanabaena phage Pam5]